LGDQLVGDVESRIFYPAGRVDDAVIMNGEINPGGTLFGQKIDAKSAISI